MVEVVLWILAKSNRLLINSLFPECLMSVVELKEWERNVCRIACAKRGESMSSESSPTQQCSFSEEPIQYYIGNEKSIILLLFL